MEEHFNFREGEWVQQAYHLKEINELDSTLKIPLAPKPLILVETTIQQSHIASQDKPKCDMVELKRVVEMTASSKSKHVIENASFLSLVMKANPLKHVDVKV